jgi:isoquinoline 1-oxidoreductase alpha subunit
MAAIKFAVNGKQQTVDVAPQMPLLWVLRDTLGLTGTKFGCGMQLCGACTVHIDGVATRSCEVDVPQCGYCQSGQIMSAAALLAKNKAPTDAEIDTAMRGNICRCGTYQAIREAIHKAGGAK